MKYRCPACHEPFHDLNMMCDHYVGIYRVRYWTSDHAVLRQFNWKIATWVWFAEKGGQPILKLDGHIVLDSVERIERLIPLA